MSANQTLIQGENSIREISSAVVAAGHHSLFLITGMHFRLDEYSGLLNGIEVTHFIKSGTNVDAQEVEKAYDNFLNAGARVIAAIGGGSVIDLAKTVIYRCIQSSATIPFFVTVPTTSGSGSEATHFAVVYRNKRKYSLAHRDLLPHVVILDPVLTYSLSPYLTAVTGMDAFSQAVESFWNVNAIAESQAYAQESILLWEESFIHCVNLPTVETRKKMLLASHLAGKAINITRTTGPHALSYYLTIHHSVPHGQAVALFLPVFFLYNKPVNELLSVLKVNDELEAKEMIQRIMKQAGLATNFYELGLDKTTIIDELLNEMSEERFANNPVSFDREKLKQLILEEL